jgi:5-dehydro-2-deoxygluconokinase
MAGRIPEPGERRFDLITIGRAAVDLYGEQVGGRLEDMASFAKYLGGCPANIAVGASRLELNCAMITRVGDEHMGRFVREALDAELVDVSHVATDPQRLTGLVILGIRDRETFPLIFYRENCADMALSPADMDAAFIAQAQAIVVTGTHFSTPGVDAASRAAIAHARAAGTKVVLDIDYRPVLWGLTGRGLGEQRFVASDSVSAHLQTIVPHCDLIVGTEEEFHIAGGARDTLAALRSLRALTAATFVVKRGAQGCTIFTDAIPARIDDGLVCAGFPVEVFNVLGAGDGFMAGLLRGWLRGETWERAARIANACGALVVSRHGCAPAMPSWIEIEDFLARADGLRRLHDDPRIAYLHRVTNRRELWRDMRVLAFDHRKQFAELAARHNAGTERIAAFKRLLAGVVLADPGISGGAIVDDEVGRDALFALNGERVLSACPIELPGSRPLEFVHGPDPAITLRTWPAAQVVKCLVHYHPDDPVPLREAQESQLLKLSRACIATDHAWLLEVIPPHDAMQSAAAVQRTVERFYGLGIQPNWWKLPPYADRALWRALGDVIREHDPYCRGILILGLERPESELALSFTSALFEPMVRGFAVGRSIFWAAAEEWFAGRIDDRQATARVAANYWRLVELWRARWRAL